MPNTCPNICCSSLVFFSPNRMQSFRVTYNLLLSVALLAFSSSVYIINNYPSALVFHGPFFLNDAGCELPKGLSACTVTPSLPWGKTILVIIVIYMFMWIYLRLLPPELIHFICYSSNWIITLTMASFNHRCGHVSKPASNRVPVIILQWLLIRDVLFWHLNFALVLFANRHL